MVCSWEACSSVAGGGKLSAVMLWNVMPCYFWSRETKRPEGEQVLQLGGLWRAAWPRCAVGHWADCCAQHGSTGAAGSMIVFLWHTLCQRAAARCKQWSVWRKHVPLYVSSLGALCSGSVALLCPSSPCLVPLQLFPQSSAGSHAGSRTYVPLCGRRCSGEMGTKKVPLAAMALASIFLHLCAEPTPPSTALGPWWVMRGPFRALHYLQLAVLVLKTQRIHTVVVKSKKKMALTTMNPEGKLLFCAEVILLIASQSCL